MELCALRCLSWYMPCLYALTDLMIVGVSRSGKTPLCIYLGQRGYKVTDKLRMSVRGSVDIR